VTWTSARATARPLSLLATAAVRPVIAPISRRTLIGWPKKPDEDFEKIPLTKDGRGNRAEQVQARLRGEIRFSMGVLKGPFGTLANPTVVASAYEERVVGCQGDGADYEHALLWMTLKDNGKKHMCQACGQFFILKRDPSGAAPEIH